MTIDKKELENFLDYLLDKIEVCYYEETKIAICCFLEDNK